MMCYFICRAFLAGLFLGTTISLFAALISYFVCRGE